MSSARVVDGLEEWEMGVLNSGKGGRGVICVLLSGHWLLCELGLEGRGVTHSPKLVESLLCVAEHMCSTCWK